MLWSRQEACKSFGLPAPPFRPQLSTAEPGHSPRFKGGTWNLLLPWLGERCRILRWLASGVLLKYCETRNRRKKASHPWHRLTTTLHGWGFWWFDTEPGLTPRSPSLHGGCFKAHWLLWLTCNNTVCSSQPRAWDAAYERVIVTNSCRVQAVFFSPMPLKLGYSWSIGIQLLSWGHHNQDTPAALSVTVSQIRQGVWIKSLTAAAAQPGNCFQSRYTRHNSQAQRHQASPWRPS